MTDVYISEGAALRILMIDGDFSEAQARIVLGHSRQQAYEGRTLYPATYISKRARDHAAQPRCRVPDGRAAHPDSRRHMGAHG